VIVGMRNRLVHASFDVNSDILWRTVTISLPLLLRQLHAVEGFDADRKPSGGH
jgi:uncharacterized protein with HEPN domain